jgi:hypothetical protein
MYVVIAEDTMDVNCLKILIKKILNKPSISIEGKGFGSCGDMLNKGAKFLSLYEKQESYRKVIICHDRDKYSKEEVYKRVVSNIISSAKLKNKLICILIPTEEIEAWILADMAAIVKVFPSFVPPKQPFFNPEKEPDPKEKIKGLLNKNKPRPLYMDTNDNKKIIEELDLDAVKKKCPSFAELHEFVKNDISNYPNKNS